MLQETLLSIVVKINAYLSDYILIFLLVGVGLFYSIKTRFVQVRCFGEGMKKVFGNLKLFGGKQESGELPLQYKKHSIYEKNTVGTFKFCIIHKLIPHKSELSAADKTVLKTKYFVRRLAGSKPTWFGLDTSNVIIEKVPMIIPSHANIKKIKRET